MALTFTHTAPFVTSSRNPIFWRATCDPLWQTYDDYYVKVILQIEEDFRSATYSKWIEYREIPNPNDGHSVMLNIKGLLESYVDHDKPNWASPLAPRVCEAMNTRYGMTIQEIKDGAVMNAYNYPFQHVVHAGVSRFNFAKGANLDVWQVAGKFLTLQPRSKRVTCESPEFLYFMIPNVSLTSVNFKVEATLNNGTTVDASPAGVLAVDQYDIITFPAGHNQLALQGIGTPVVSWKIWVETDGGTPISEEMEYVIDCCEFSPTVRYWLWENSLGGYDTLRTVGKAKGSIKTSGGQAQRIEDPLYAQADHQLFSYNDDHQEHYEQYTGFNSQEELAWAKGILASRQVFRIGDIYPNPDASGDLWPVNVAKSDTSWFEDREYLHSLKFKITDAFKSEAL